MRLARLLAMGLLLAAAVGLAGCSGGASAWHGRDLSEKNPPWHNATVQPGWSFRWDVVSRSQEELAWDWFVDERQAIGFGIYRHDPEGMTELRAIHATDDKGDLFAQFSALHAYIWTNDSPDPVNLWVRADTPVGGGFYPPGQDPKSDVCRASASVLC